MSCDFCKTLKNETKDIRWNVRSTYAEDNICEYINGENCSCCSSCDSHFKLNSHNFNGNIRVSMEFYQKINDIDKNEIIIEPFSETMQWNYCPICGDKISDTTENDICLGYKTDIINKDN